MATRATIGSLRAEMQANSAAFGRDMGKARQSVRRASRGMERDFNKVNKSIVGVGRGMKALAGVAGVTLGAGAVFALGKFIKSSLEAADSIGKTADSVGLSTDALQEYRLIAQLAGLSTAELDKNMGQLSKRVGEARADTGSLAEFLKRSDEGMLRNIRSAKSMDDAIDIVFEGMQALGDQTDRNALANAAFGRAGIKMTNIIRDGSKSIKEQRQEMRDLGLVIEEDLIRNAEKAIDQLTIMGSIVTVNAQRLALQLAPTIIRIGKAFGEAAPDIRRAADALIDFVGAEEFLSVKAIDEKIAELREEQQQVRDILTGEELGDVGAAVFGALGIREAFEAREKEIKRLLALRQQIEQEDADARKMLDQEVANARSKTIDKAIKDLEREKASLGLSNAELRARQIILALGIDQNSKAATSIRELTTAIDTEKGFRESLFEEVEKASQQAAESIAVTNKSTAALNLQNAELESLIGAAGRGSKAFEEQSNQIERENEAREKNIDLSTKQGRAWEVAREKNQQLEDQLEKATEAMNKSGDGARQMADAIGTAFEDAVIKGGSLRDVFNGLLADAQRIALRNIVTIPLQGLLTKGLGTLGIPGLQHGADFRVGGAGGPDSQLLMAAVTPGERIVAIPPGESFDGAGGTQNFAIDIHVDGATDADSFRASVPQIADDLAFAIGDRLARR